MDSYQIDWKRSALKELKKAPKETILRITQAVQLLKSDPFPSGTKKLAGADHTYRLRLGDYRVVYSVYSDRLVIEIIRVGHRKDIYRKLDF